MAQPLSFGLLFDFRNPLPWRRPWADLYAEALDTIAWSEELGFDVAWLPEHHQTEDGFLPSPLPVMAAVAARTRRLGIGSGLVLAPFYDPVRFAQDAAVIDVLANGRLMIGAGLGYRRRETAAHGIDFRTRASRADEFLGIVRRLWAGETVTHAGRHFSTEGAKLLPGPVNGAIPLLIGGVSEKSMRRVARYGDAYLGWPELAGPYAEALAAEGRDPAAARILVPSMNLVVDDDPERALDELAPYYHYVNNTYGGWLNEDAHAGDVQVEDAPQAMSLEEFKVSGLLRCMTPQDAIAFFNQMRVSAPVEHVMFSVPPGIPAAKFARYLENFARDVIPAFRNGPGAMSG